MPAPTDLRLTPLEDHESPSGLVPPGPDPAAVGFRQASAAQPDGDGGFFVDLELVVENVGDEPSDPTEAVLVRSRDGRFGPDAGGDSDDEFAGVIPVPALDPGEAQAVTVQFFLDPETDAVGGFLLVGVNQQADFEEAETEPVADADPHNNANQGLGIDGIRFAPELPTAEVFDNGDPIPVPLRTAFDGTLADDADADVLQLTVPEDGRLTVTLAPNDTALDPRVQLFTADGELVVGADDRAADDAGARLVRHLPAGDYFLEVTAEAGAGGYRLTTAFDPSNLPGADLSLPDADPLTVLVADLDADGRSDLFTLNSDGSAAALLGLGDGTFQPPVTTALGTDLGEQPEAVPTDLNADTFTDLLVVDAFGDLVPLLGRGDGTFDQPEPLTLDAPLSRLTAGDLDGDGITDVAGLMADPDGPAVVVFRGVGDGTLADPVLSVLPDDPAAVAVDLVTADVDADEAPELLALTALDGVGTLFVLSDRGDGGLGLVNTTAAAPVGRLTAAELVGGTAADLVIANEDGGLTLLLGRGDGSFAAGPPLPDLGPATAVGAVDLDADGDLDLAVGTDDPELLVNDAGTFSVMSSVLRRSPTPAELAVADFNGDRLPDVVTIDDPAEGDGPAVLTVTPGRPAAVADADLDLIPTGLPPVKLLEGDLSGDGHPDLVAVAIDADGPTFSALVGRPGGGFTAVHQTTEDRPVTDAALADLNRDGLSDLVAVVPNGDDPTELVVRLGLGDGRFADADAYLIGDGGYALAAADVTGDGTMDVVLRSIGTVTPALNVFVGSVGGQFGGQLVLELDAEPVALSAIDAVGDRPAVAVGFADGAVELYRGTADGPVLAQTLTSVPGLEAVRLVRLDADEVPDLVSLHTAADGVSSLVVRRAAESGAFSTAETPVAFVRTPGVEPAIVVAEATGDDRVDLLVPDAEAVFVSAGVGGGQFTVPDVVDTPGVNLSGAVFADVTGDQFPDVLAADPHADGVRVRVGGVDGFARLRPADSPAAAGTTVAFDLTSDGNQDTLVLDAGGRVLLYDADESAPRVVNPDAPAVHFAPLITPTGPAVAAVSADGFLTVHRLADGEPVADDPIPVGRLPIQVVAGDLNGDGFTDVAVADGLDATVAVVLTGPSGEFAELRTLPTGGAGGQLALAPLDATGSEDLLVFDAAADELSVLLGPAVDEAAELRFGGVPGTGTVVAGEFDGRPGADAVAVPAGGGQLALFSGSGSSGFADPVPAGTIGPAGGTAVAGDFNADALLDLAVLDPTTNVVRVALGNGAGQFGEPVATAAGPAPAGLAVADADGDAIPDLRVGDRFGGLTSLFGQGDGTFTDRSAAPVPLDATDLNADGVADLVFVEPTTGDVVGYTRDPFGNALTEQFRLADAPALVGAVRVSDLNQDGQPDLILADTSGNGVQVRTASGPFTFDPAATFPAGLRPTAVVPVDLNADGVTDLVTAAERSNDVVVLLGSITEGEWTATPGPTVRTAGIGPAAVAVQEDEVSGATKLLVSNRRSGTVDTLTGVGDGFFTAGAETAVLPGASAAGPPPVFDPDTGGGFAATAEGDLIGFDADDPDGVRTITRNPPGTADPVVGLQLLALAGGSGLLTTAESGLVTLDAVAPDGSLFTLGVAFASGPPVAAVGVLSAAGADVFVVGLDGTPSVLTVRPLIPPPPPVPPVSPPPDPPTVPPPGEPPVPKLIDALVSAPSAALGTVNAADGGQLLQQTGGTGSTGGTGATGPAVVSGRSEGTMSTDPNAAGGEDEPTTAWERFYLDLGTLGRSFGRPPTAPPEPPAAPPPALDPPPPGDEEAPAEDRLPQVGLLGAVAVGAMGERFRRLVRRRPGTPTDAAKEARRPPALPFAGERADG